MHPTQNDGEFARLLAGIQERTGLSDQAIADVAGINRSQVWRWTHSGSAPGYDPVRRIAAWLIAERPEVAEQAAALLPAAGYAALPGPPADLPDHDADWRPRPGPGTATLDEIDAAEPVRDGILERYEALAADGAGTDGEGMFPDDPILAAAWNTCVLNGETLRRSAWAVAIIAVQMAGSSSGRRTGTAGALTLA